MATDLRKQFLNYMTLQRFSDYTKRGYITSIKGLAKYYKLSPDTLSNEQIQDRSGIFNVIQAQNGCD